MHCRTTTLVVAGVLTACLAHARQVSPLINRDNSLDLKLARPTPVSSIHTAVTRGRAQVQASGARTFLGRAEPWDRTTELQVRGPWGGGDEDEAVAVEQARQYFHETAGRQIATDDLLLNSIMPEDNGFLLRFVQTAHGLPIEGTYAVASVHGGTVRYALQYLIPSPSLANTVTQRLDLAEKTAGADLTALAGAVTWRRGGHLVIAHVGEQARVAWRVEVHTQRPFGHWAVFVDASTGEILGRHELGASAVQGTIRFKVEPVCQGDPTVLVGMPQIRWAEGKNADDAGKFYSATDVQQAEIRLWSPVFRLNNQGGALAGPWTYQLTPSADNNFDITDAPLDQTDPYYNAHKVRAWALSKIEDNNSQKQWMETKVDLNINVPDTCNAYFDGSINLFQEGNGCLNTGRVSTVLYHEYGHGIHINSGGNFDGQVSEGIADFAAATINNTPEITGLYGCDDAFRTCNNDLTYCRSGCDIGPNTEVHAAAEPLCAVLWELRGYLIERYGYDLGVATTDRIFLRFLTHVGDMFSAYDAAISADDDDDQDPSNGTKHSCEINKAFANDEAGSVAHFPDLVGKVPSQPSMSLVHEPPGRVLLTPGDVPSLELEAKVAVGCAGDGAAGEVTLHYSVNDEVEKTVMINASGTGADASKLVLPLEDVSPPAKVVYYITARIGPTEFVYPEQGPKCPRNNKWPCYRQSVWFAAGGEQDLYFSDFETDDGGLIAGTANPDGLSDFEWGTPAGLSGDPTVAVSGSKIWGTDLGTSGDGLYSRARTSFLDLPVLDASRFEQVRLQFWRQILSSDTTRVLVNDREVYLQRWTSFFWKDPVWIFQDIDISRLAANNEQVRIRFELRDEFVDSFEYGGWNIDDVRVVGMGANGSTTPGEPEEESAESASQARTLMGLSSCSFAPAASESMLLCAIGLILGRRRRSGQRRSRSKPGAR